MEWTRPSQESLPQSVSTPTHQFILHRESSHLARAIITITKEITQPLIAQIIALCKKEVSVFGMPNTTAEYVETNYKNAIESSLLQFLLKFSVIDFLFDTLNQQRIFHAHHPRLTHMDLLPNGEAQFQFHVSTTGGIDIREWSHFLFKAPKRKNYKDLDKQVVIFIKQQQDAAKRTLPSKVEPNDWVCFEATVLDMNNKPLLPPLSNTFWVRMTQEVVAYPFLELFADKTIGSTFISNNFSLTPHFDIVPLQSHPISVAIQDLVKGAYCSLDSVKNLFKLKNKTEIHRKCIEVFSYRNDISQRKAIIEEMFHLFFSKHRFEVSKHLVTRKQEDILCSLRKHPDYHVYKTQTNFKRHIELLAEKQIKEEMLIDQLAYREQIFVDINDVKHYLNLFGTPRSKEFIYFKQIPHSIEEMASLIHVNTLRNLCRREKTLNHILYQLTR